MAASPSSTILPQYRQPGFWAASSAYLITFTLFLLLISHNSGAYFQISWLGMLNLVTALVLISSNLWLITHAYGFRLHIVILQGVLIGMLVDLLLLNGLSLLYHTSPPWQVFIYLLMLVASVCLVSLMFQENADSLHRFRREQGAETTDPLTGVLNRLGVVRGHEALSALSELTVIMIDLNDLKAVNDLGGHGAGDRHLQRLSQALRFHLPDGSLLGRWGGDEFVAVVPFAVDVEAALALVQHDVPHPNRTLPSFAYGAVTASAHLPLNRTLAKADQLMYENKNATYQAVAGGLQHRGGHVGLTDFPHFLMSLNTQQEVLEEGMRKAAQLSGFEAWFYYQVQDQQVFGQAEIDGEIERRSADEICHPSGIITAAMERRSMVWTADYEQSPYAQYSWVERGLKSVMAMPVVFGDQVAGVAGFFSHHLWQSVTPQSRQLLEAVTFHLGHQLERGAVTEQLRASVEAGITGMGVILEARDMETAGHTARVVELARQLGMAANLSIEDLQALRLGAYLHDVGKLAIPDRVLLKPGPLDTEEWALMKTHSELGARMAGRLPSLPDGTVEVVRSHHERWDGKGYPQGLAGEAIPMLARIFALCDVYDALINVRPYKEAWTPAAAQRELLAQAGKQFDPHLTTIFIESVLNKPLAKVVG